MEEVICGEERIRKKKQLWRSNGEGTYRKESKEVLMEEQGSYRRLVKP